MQKLRSILQSNFFFLFLFLLTGIYVLIFLWIPHNSLYDESTSWISGRILDYEWDQENLKITLLGKEKILVYYRASENEKNELEKTLGCGVILNLKGSIAKPKGNSIPNTFNYQKYLYYENIHYLFYADSLEITKTESFIYKIKNLIIKYVDSFSNPYLSSLLLGRKSDLDTSMYQKNGVSHLFAISGMHFAFFISICEIFLKKNRFGKILLSFFLLGYSFLVSFTPSVLRVFVWYHAKLFNHSFHNLWSEPKLFAIMFCGFLIFNPFFLFQIGFQYSFLLSFCYLFLKEKEKGWISKLKICSFLFLVSLPITAIHFYEINFCSILFNFLLIPFISILYPLCFLTLIFPLCSNFLLFLFQIFEGINKCFQYITIGLVGIPKVSLLFWIIYYIVLYFLFRRRQKKYFFFLLLILLMMKITPKIDSSSYVTFLDVGQGDSALLIFPHQRKTVLIDTGGNVNDEEYQVAKNMKTYFQSLGMDQIDTLILTHGDADHAKNAIELIQNFKIKKVMMNCGNTNSLEEEILNLLHQKKIPVTFCESSLDFDQNKLYFINPLINQNENDTSSVIYTKIDSYAFLFMGDASTKVEENLLEKYTLKNIDVLKVGHHGSETSSSKKFIQVVNPKYAVISVGKNNSYGHPSDKVLENLKNSKIYRTDLDGSIVFQIQNHHLKIRTYPI